MASMNARSNAYRAVLQFHARSKRLFPPSRADRAGKGLVQHQRLQPPPFLAARVKYRSSLQMSVYNDLTLCSKTQTGCNEVPLPDRHHRRRLLVPRIRAAWESERSLSRSRTPAWRC
jgi:hypothetical protein